MGEDILKPGWTRVKFGEVVRLNTERCADPLAKGIERYVGLEHMTPGDLRVREWGLVAEGTTFTNLFRPGQVLFGKRRAYQRKVAVAEFAGVCSGDIYVFESGDPQVLLPELLPFICQTERFFDHAVGTSAGSLSPRTNWTQLAEYEFALPPLDVQHRIVKLLITTDGTKESYQELIKESQQLWNTAAYTFFSETGEALSNGVVKLGDYLSYSSDGPFGSKLKTEHYSLAGVRVIRLKNIDKYAFNDEDKAFIPEKYYQDELTGYTVLAGDVLIAGLGDDNIQAGRACIAPDTLGLAINKADCYCLRPTGELMADFLMAFLNSPHGLRQSLSFAQGTTRFRLNLGNIKRMKVPLPSRQTQEHIVQTLTAIYQSGVHTQTRLEKQGIVAKELLNGLLN